MTTSLNRLGFVLLVGFLAVALSAGYWSVLASSTLTERADNPRRVEYEQGLWRGSIFDRNGALLAESVPNGESLSGKPVFRRSYPQQNAGSAIGYFSFVHGTGGIEEGYDSALRGDSRLSALDKAVNQLLHRVQRGSDVRLTLDLPLELRLYNAMQAYKGAAIVLEAPDGAIRAMVSVPSFDPNRLDQTFDALAKAPDAPLLNRVTQGIYQPGGALETIIFSALLSSGSTTGTAVVGAGEPVVLNGLTLPCALPNQNVDTLLDAYSFGCARPFAEAAMRRQMDIQNAFDAFGLTRRPVLAEFRTAAGPPIAPLFSLANDPELLQAQGAGQGQLLVTPLQMAIVAGAIANHGNAVQPYLAQATRVPGADWQPVLVRGEQPAVTSRETADALRAAMRDAVLRGAAQAANLPNRAVYGHASYALSGPQARTTGPSGTAPPTASAPVNGGTSAVSWFIGFADNDDGSATVVVIVLEGLNDPAAAARVGRAALQ